MTPCISYSTNIQSQTSCYKALLPIFVTNISADYELKASQPCGVYTVPAQCSSTLCTQPDTVPPCSRCQHPHLALNDGLVMGGGGTICETKQPAASLFDLKEHAPSPPYWRWPGAYLDPGINDTLATLLGCSCTHR